MEAWRYFEPGQVHKFLSNHGRQLDKMAAAIAQPAQLFLPARDVNEKGNFQEECKSKHRESEEDEKEEDACETASSLTRLVSTAPALYRAAQRYLWNQRRSHMGCTPLKRLHTP
eukprot:993030-Prymnesium_polylepis.1